MNTLSRIVPDEAWRTPRRALTLAMLFVLVYIAAVIAGSAIQSAPSLPLSMGWFQQIAATVTAVLFAFTLREPHTQRGLRRPTRGWLMTAILAAAAIALGGGLASRALPPEHTRYSLEDFGYGQANTFVSLAHISGRSGTPLAHRSPFLFQLSHFNWTHVSPPLKRHSS